MKKLKLYSLLIVITISCSNNQKTNLRHNNIKQIFFATGGCYGQCPYMAIAIDSSLNYYYQGNRFTEKFGVLKGKISKAFWDTLNIKLENLEFEKLDTLYENSVDDLSTEIIIYYKDKRRHIIGQSASLPPKLMEVYNWLFSASKRIKLTPLFQTTIQNPPLHPSPIELKHQFKATPPKE